ncbi:hypothetical protein OG301_05575 [Streptomyces platensis]|uniref:hypothetical protein n=1 Tax=Streptomyces platensis TaxID=58346 RepID=UPI002ED2D500|nr:hypothetical protein OG301_05575 [Streptomyces platensis]
MPGDIWIGDLLTAFVRVGADDAAQQESVARLLGFDVAAHEPPGTAEPQEDVPPPGPPGRPGESARPQPRPVGPTATPVALAAVDPSIPANGTGLRLLAPVAHEPRPEVEWQVASLPLPPAGQHRSKPLPHEPLLAPRSSSAILQLALSRITADGEPDIPETVRRLASGHPLTEVPLEPVRTLRFGVQVLVDLGAGMEPFGRDQQELVAQVQNTVGQEHTEVRYFEGSPLQGTGPGHRRSWRPYEPPARGTRVLVLSDLGLGGSGLGPRRGTPADWREWGRLIEGAECTGVAFVPYPCERWPAWATRLMHIVSWDRHTTVGRIVHPGR